MNPDFILKVKSRAEKLPWDMVFKFSNTYLISNVPICTARYVSFLLLHPLGCYPRRGFPKKNKEFLKPSQLNSKPVPQCYWCKTYLFKCDIDAPYCNACKHLFEEFFFTQPETDVNSLDLYYRLYFDHLEFRAWNWEHLCSRN